MAAPLCTHEKLEKKRPRTLLDVLALACIAGADNKVTTTGLLLLEPEEDTLNRSAQRGSARMRYVA